MIRQPSSSRPAPHRLSRRSLLIALTALAGSTGLLVGLGVSSTLAAEKGQPQVKVLRIGLQKSSTFNILRARGDLARRLQPQGIQVTWAEFTSGPPLLEALAAGKIDVGEVGDAPVIFAQAKNAPIVYFGQSQPNPEAVALLVPKDSPIRTLADLRNKKLAFAKGSSAQPLVVNALAKAGLKLSDITPVYLQPPEARVAFESGKIDAWAVWDPFYAAAQVGGNARVLANGRGHTPFRLFFVANSDFAATNASLLPGLLRDLRSAGQWALANPGRSADFLSKATKIPVDVLEVSERRRLGRYQVSPIQTGGLRDQQQVADTFARLKLIPKPINVNDIVVNVKN
ncbi:sulfonate ABC transporter substrate-binding protein [Vulcanococcus limneticus]